MVIEQSVPGGSLHQTKHFLCIRWRPGSSQTDVETDRRPCLYPEKSSPVSSTCIIVCAREVALQLPFLGFNFFPSVRRLVTRQCVTLRDETGQKTPCFCYLLRLWIQFVSYSFFTVQPTEWHHVCLFGSKREHFSFPVFLICTDSSSSTSQHNYDAISYLSYCFTWIHTSWIPEGEEIAVGTPCESLSGGRNRFYSDTRERSPMLVMYQTHVQAHITVMDTAKHFLGVEEKVKAAFGGRE